MYLKLILAKRYLVSVDKIISLVNKWKIVGIWEKVE